MIIEYSNKKIEKICTDLKHSKKKLGDRESINLFKMINFIENIDSVEELINMKRYGSIYLMILGASILYRLVV